MMKKKVVLITGGTSGVGLAIAKSFAEIPTEIVLVGRNRARAIAAVQEIQSLSPSSDVSYLLGDLADPTENKRLATTFMTTHSRLDILFNSAGNIPKTASNNIALNLQSHYWLTHNLASTLEKSDDPRVFIITGMPLAIQLGPVYEHQFNLVDRGLWLLTHKTLLVTILAHELKSWHIKVNALFPGGVQSDLLPWTKNLGNTEVAIASKLATQSRYQTITGQFFDDKGNLVRLNNRKYGLKRAKSVLKRYLPLKTDLN
ncbi:MAG TPA: dehydrogenase [Lactobacillus sp.]|nr:dehydrogenase [Lactobacillus sp.]